MMRGSAKIFLLVLSMIALIALSASALDRTASWNDTAKLQYFLFTGYAYPYFAPLAKEVMQDANLPATTLRTIKMVPFDPDMSYGLGKK